MSSSFLGYSEHASHLWHRWYSTAAWRKRRAPQLTIEPLYRMYLAEAAQRPRPWLITWCATTEAILTCLTSSRASP
jgi:hypothetical protein